MLSFYQQKLLSYFENSIKDDSVRHAYILKGPRGVGKKYLSHLIELYFACNHSMACKECTGCKSAIAGANFDIVRLVPNEKNKSDIQKVRTIIKRVYEKPSGGKYKFVVIESAHIMESVCQNALLKIIEEPPAYVVFLLLCDSVSNILPTIMSRVMTLELLPWSKEEMVSCFPLDNEDSFLYNYCMGNPGVLKSLLEDENFKSARSAAIGAILKVVDSSQAGAFEAFEILSGDKEHLHIMLEAIVSLLRDVMFLKNGLSDQIVNTDKMSEIKEISNSVTLAKCFNLTEIVGAIPSDLRNNENVSMQIQSMIMRIESVLKQ